MTNFMILVVILLVIIFLAFLYILFTLKTIINTSSKTAENPSIELDKLTIFDWISRSLALASLVFIILSFITPFLLTKSDIGNTTNFRDTGAIGDTFGGLMNPFIAIAGVFVTGLAFYIQFKANLMQRVIFNKQLVESKNQFETQLNKQKAQIELQQFESQFYEMLRLHRDNVTEMKIEGYDFEETNSGLKKFDKITEGRKVFVTMKTEFECILTCFANGGKLNHDLFNKSYRLFFAGLDDFKKSNPAENRLTGLLEIARTKHESPDFLVVKNQQRKDFLKGANLNFNYKPFSGHASRLGHYFRHLYLTVKVVVNSKVISEYDDKMKYLKILRAQLSNHEQMLLFYNWLSGYGEDWQNDKNQFFTEYRMIHNLWYDQLLNDEFISEQVDILRKTATFHQDAIFEIDPPIT